MGAMIAAMVAFVFTLQGRSPVAAFQAPSDPLAHWKLDELDGSTTVADASTNGNHGTAVDAMKWTTGVLSGALEFNGTSDYVRVLTPAGSSLRQPTIGYAIAAWVKVSGTGSKGGDVATLGDNYALRIQPDGNVKTFFYSTMWHAATTTNVDVIDGGWHHVVGQYDGTKVTVYVDGEQKQFAPYPGLTINYARGTDFYLGKHGNNGTEHTFAGLIDQVRVYDRALSANDIARLAAEPPVAHWKLDESDGNTVASDSSIGGNAGTVSDAQAWTTEGRIGGALTFTGSSYMSVANPSPTPPARSLKPQREYAISAWVKAQATGPYGADVATMGDSYALRIQPNGAVKTFYHDGSNWRGHTAQVDVLATDRWHHLLGQYNGTRIQIYVDGVLHDGPADYPGSTIHYAGRGPSFVMGRQGNGGGLHNLTGTVDHVRVFARALTHAEAIELASEPGPVPPDPPSLQPFRVLTWNLRKCKNTGDGAKSCARIAQDIQTVQPDVLLLSAVETEEDAKLIANALGWPLPHYGKAPGGGEGQAIISHFPMDRLGDEYEPRVELITSPNTAENQVIIRATLTIGGRKAHFFAIDQDHVSKPARTDQANAARAWAWQFKGDGLPLIVGGDFNMEVGEGITEWLRPQDANDPAEAFFDDWTRAESRAEVGENGRTKRFRIDHILSYRGDTGLETGAAKVSVVFINNVCQQVTVTLCDVGKNECTNACDSWWKPEDTGVRASDHAILSVDFRLPSGS